MPRNGDDAGATAARPCTACGGAMRFSHREYAGRGATTVVLRCAACGAVVTHAASASGDDKPRMRSRKPPVDEGPPRNTVLDSDTARRLLQQLGTTDDPGAG